MDAATAPQPVPESAAQQARLVVALENLHVRYATSLALAWLGMRADRLLGRSLMLSQPELGQALTLALAGGLSPLPAPLGVVVTRPDGMRVTPLVHQVDADAIVEFQALAEEPARPEPTGLQRRMDEMRQDLAALRRRVPCDEAMLRGDDPILFWLWQAEAALKEVERRLPTLQPTRRHTTTDVHRRAAASA